MTVATTTTMYREAAEAPDRVQDQLVRNAGVLAALADRLRTNPPIAMVTIGRGSSDHAATYARYLVETRLGILASSLSPLIFSVFNAPLSLENVLCLVISQSGRSPDLLAAARAGRDSGGIVVVLVNDPGSPLADLASIVLPQGAGPEKSAAATKSFITSLSAIAQMVALWSDDASLQAALPQLPPALAQSLGGGLVALSRQAADGRASLCRRAWIAFGNRAGSRTQAEGNLHDPCGSL
jgi:glutamine---fructose-6-phosphate transaminase (isomerizing)